MFTAPRIAGAPPGGYPSPARDRNTARTTALRDCFGYRLLAMTRTNFYEPRVRAFVALVCADAAGVPFDTVESVDVGVIVALDSAAAGVVATGVLAVEVHACDCEVAAGWITAETSSVADMVVAVDAAAEPPLVPRARPIRGKKLRTLAERMPARIAW